MKQISCVLCGSSDYRPVITGRDRLLLLPGEFTVVKCRKCGLIFTNPQPSTDELAYYYPENYSPYRGGLSKSGSQDETLWKRLKTVLKQSPFGPVLKSIVDSRVTYIPNLSEQAKVLEVGCATGQFLASLRNKRWDLYGVELAKSPATYAKQELGLNVFCGTLEEANFANDYFDGVFAWQVVEHFSNPVRTLREISRVLKKDGCLAFSIPNAGSWEFGVFRDKWYGLDLPRHLFQFSLRSIKKVLEAGDFSVEKVFYQKNINQIVGSLAYWLDDVKRGNAVSTYLRTFPHCTNRFLTPFSQTLAIFLSVIRQSGRMTLVCRAKKQT